VWPAAAEIRAVAAPAPSLPPRLQGAPAGTAPEDPLAVWREHWRSLTGALLLIAAEAILIGALLVERARRQTAAHTLKERLEFDRMIALISTNFAHASDEALDGPIQAALGWIGRFLDVDAVALEEALLGRAAAAAPRTWVRADVGAGGEEVRALLAGAAAGPEAEGWEPGEGAARSVFALHLPLELRGEVIGSLSLVRRAGRPPWTAERTRRLRLVLDLIASALARQGATQALAESEALSSAVLDALPSEVAVLDEQGVIVRVNEAWRRGGPPWETAASRDPVGMAYLEACRRAAESGDEEGATVLDGLRPVLEGSAPTFTAEYVRGGAPEPRWFALRVQALSRPLRGAVVSHLDITGRKRAELEAINRLQALAHANRAATIGALAGSLAHELNQPLTAMLSNAQAGLRLLVGGPPQIEMVRDILSDVATDAYRAGEIIRRTRHLLKQDEPERVLLDVADVVSETIRTVGDEALLRKVRVSVEAEPDVPQVEADPVQLQQVVLNLLLNGFDAMEPVAPEERVLSVRIAPSADGGVEIVVQDRGPGVEPQRLTRIFEPFYTTKGSGMGMGLYVTRAIVDAHGGTITAASEPGRGLEVRVRLPTAGPPRRGGTEAVETPLAP
jgi:signal transduction histidine kinase